LKPGEFFGVIEGLSVADAADLHIDFLDDAGAVMCRTNPIRIEPCAPITPFLG
jgi:hypothetical protein